jgi:hypothetical protein
MSAFVQSPFMTQRNIGLDAARVQRLLTIGVQIEI